MTPVSPNITNADDWIDQKLAWLRQSIELPGEIASTEPGAAPLPRRRARGRAGSGRHARMPGGTIVGCILRELHARRFDIVAVVVPFLSSVALGFLIALLLK
jgi:hypothetical protein